MGLSYQIKVRCSALTFTHFLTAIEVQFGTKVKAVQTDGGGEFLALTTLFNTRGMAHGFACPHTHHVTKMPQLTANADMLKQVSPFLLKQGYHSTIETLLA